MNSMVGLMAGFILMVASGCDVRADEPSARDTDRKLARLRADIAGLVGAAKCVNLVNCRIAALGVDACGGATEYIAYSWLSTEKAALETRIAEYNFALEDAQKQRTPADACTASPEPVAACVNGRCVIPLGR